MHYSLRFITYFLCCTARLPACLSVSVCFFLKTSLFCRWLETLKPENLGLLPSACLTGRVGARTCVHRVCIRCVQRPCNHLTHLQGEFYQVHPEIDICRSVCPYQPQIKAENRRQGGAGGSWGGLRCSCLMSVKALISVEERPRLCAQGHRSLTPSSAHLIVSLLGARGGCCFPKVRGRIFSSKLGFLLLLLLLFYLIGPQLRHLAGLLRPTRRWWGGKRVQIHSSSSSCHSWAHVAVVFLFTACARFRFIRCILDGMSGKDVQAKQPCVPGEAMVKWYTARKHKVCEWKLQPQEHCCI